MRIFEINANPHASTSQCGGLANYKRELAMRTKVYPHREQLEMTACPDGYKPFLVSTGVGEYYCFAKSAAHARVAVSKHCGIIVEPLHTIPSRPRIADPSLS
jgi:hypothetical protein